MDETPMCFDMVPGYTINKKGARDVQIRSSGAEKRRLTIAVTSTGSGDVLPALTIFRESESLSSKPKKMFRQLFESRDGWIVS